MQSNVILWLAILPLVLAAFRAISIGDKLLSPTQAGPAGGFHKQIVNLTLAGLTLIGLMLMYIVGTGPFGSEDAMAITMLAFGAFVVSGYMASGFRNKTWEKFVSAAFHEAGLYWLVLGLCRLFLALTSQPTTGTGANAAPKLVLLESVTWGVIALFTLVLIIGTGARMVRR